MNLLFYDEFKSRSLIFGGDSSEVNACRKIGYINLHCGGLTAGKLHHHRAGHRMKCHIDDCLVCGNVYDVFGRVGIHFHIRTGQILVGIFHCGRGVGAEAERLGAGFAKVVNQQCADV